MDVTLVKYGEGMVEQLVSVFELIKKSMYWSSSSLNNSNSILNIKYN